MSVIRAEPFFGVLIGLKIYQICFLEFSCGLQPRSQACSIFQISSSSGSEQTLMSVIRTEPFFVGFIRRQKLKRFAFWNFLVVSQPRSYTCSIFQVSRSSGSVQTLMSVIRAESLFGWFIRGQKFKRFAFWNLLVVYSQEAIRVAYFKFLSHLEVAKHL